MNFADILDQWEKMDKKDTRPGASSFRKGRDYSVNKPEPEKRANPMDIWLNRYGVEDKDSGPSSWSRGDIIRAQAEERRRLRRMKPEAVIDLHGLTRDDAEASLDAFFNECRVQGLRKILIVHGKGLHSEGQPVLFSMVRSYIERNPYAGEFGRASNEEGGSGALWVILKKTGKGIL